MSQFSRIFLMTVTVAAFLYLLVVKGLPVPPTPDPQAFTDELLQPFLAVTWGLLGYLFNSAVFAALMTFAVKLGRKIIEFVMHPEKLGITLNDIRTQAKPNGGQQ